MLLSAGFKSGEFGGHSCSGMNSGVCFASSSVLALAQWAFQVSQGSVETLFRWGGKRLHHFAANLFRKWYTRFCQHRLSFVDVTKTFWSLFIPGHSVHPRSCLFWWGVRWTLCSVCWVCLSVCVSVLLVTTFSITVFASSHEPSSCLMDVFISILYIPIGVNMKTVVGFFWERFTVISGVAAVFREVTGRRFICACVHRLVNVTCTSVYWHCWWRAFLPRMLSNGFQHRWIMSCF